jgi:phosphoenolpyruvate-protein kinase (PTS system EI component)
MECLSLGRFLTEEEQVYRYMEVLENMEGRPVYIRLMDLGGDKKITSSGEEQHPVSGPRGSRYLLENPEVLKIQARAIARASINGCLNVIYPMITDNELFSAVKNKFLASTLLMKSGMIRHGVMFETPSACLQAHDLLREADFGSIGTNDLMEQLFNHSRNSDHAYKAASHPDLWKMIELVLKAAVDTGKPVFVCGELAKQPEFLSRFIKIGVSGISVPFKVIPDLRNHLMMKKNIPDAFEDAFLSPLNKPNNNPVD